MDKISKRDDTSVSLLIGANCTKALEPLNIIPSCENTHSKHSLVGAL